MNTLQFTPVSKFQDRYHVSRCGIVKSISRTKIDSRGRRNTNKECTIKQFTDKRSGYKTVKLNYGNGKWGSQYLHRLLAQTFIPNPDNKPVVNHINGIKTDNRLENLEWATRSENHRHALQYDLCGLPGKNSRGVFCRCTGKTYKSIRAASKTLDLKYSRLKMLLTTGTHSCFMYLNLHTMAA